MNEDYEDEIESEIEEVEVESEGIQTPEGVLEDPVSESFSDEGDCPIQSVIEELGKNGFINNPKLECKNPHREIPIRIVHVDTRHTVYGECHVDIYDKPKIATEMLREAKSYIALLKKRADSNAAIKAEEEY